MESIPLGAPHLVCGSEESTFCRIVLYFDILHYLHDNNIRSIKRFQLVIRIGLLPIVGADGIS